MATFWNKQISDCSTGLGPCAEKQDAVLFTKDGPFVWGSSLASWFFLEIGDCWICNENQPVEHCRSKSESFPPFLVIMLNPWLHFCLCRTLPLSLSLTHTYTCIYYPSSLFRNDSDATQFTYLTCMSHLSSVYSQSWASITTVNFRTFSSPLKETPFPIAVIPHLSSILPALGTHLLSVSIDLLILDILYKKLYYMWSCGLASLTECNVFKVHPYCGIYQYFFCC